jgi:hypothetical protein
LVLAYLHDQQTKLGLPLQLSDEVQSRDDAGVPGSNTAFFVGKSLEVSKFQVGFSAEKE